MSQPIQTNVSLGYPPEARLLILNADDFGMCYTENEATIRAIKDGLASSCSLMLPCPWGLHGVQLLKENPDIPFGVHLTAVSEYSTYRWRPLTCGGQVPSLVDETGCFYHEERIPEFLAQVDLDELETEFRAQIEGVLATGLQPTHMDSHCDVHIRHEGVFDMTVRLAQTYGLALRVSTPSFIDKVQQQGLPTNDHNVLDSYRIETEDKPAFYYNLLHDLPPGLSEWAMHPATDSPELRAIAPSWHVRQADYNFLTSEEAAALIQEEGIVIVDYRALQKLWA